MLNVSHLHKSYGGKKAVDDVSFTVAPGEIVGLLGPNGAGKTTTVNMVLGVLTPDAGQITINGIAADQQPSAARSATNFAAVYAPLPGNLTVQQNLRVFGLMYDVKQLRARIEAVLATYDLARFRHTKCGLLSSGEQTRVALAKAMLNQPPLLLLDEPTASLDPATAQELRCTIRQHATANQTGVLWTSHNMAEVTEVCDRVLFMAHGKILLEGEPKTLPAIHGKANLEELFIAVAREPLSLGAA
ncbi:MAG: ABC transporter ATP-binding protein [Rickettsiales bacterium]